VSKPYDVVVVGGGVAGLTAGLFSARRGRSTLVIVPLMIGGHLSTITQIEDFPGFPEGVPGFDLGPMIQEQATAAGAAFQMADASRIEALPSGWRIATTEGDVDASAVIIASGSALRTLDVRGEAEFIGKGVSHCASCDGPLLRGKSIVVVGAGDSGLQEALTLADFAKSVTVVDQASAATAQANYLRRASQHPKIAMRLDTRVVAIEGDQAVTGVRIVKGSTGPEDCVPADAVFIYAGFVPNTQWLADLVRLSATGHIITDQWMRTSRAGIFAAGDVRADSACQAVTAAGDGATAAIAVDRMLRERK
jgi:thioredoxin reductase (NADPH)